MTFFSNIATTCILFAICISAGLVLGKIKIAGVSLGITWILFVGIAVSQIGWQIDPQILTFAKECGLILFVYSIGMQVGPGFFAAFRKGGIRLNALAALVVVLGVGVACLCAAFSHLAMPNIVGILSGAVTNTPGLGAAQQTFADITGESGDSIAAGYALTYPLGVIGTIASLLLIRKVLGISLKEEEKVVSQASGQPSAKRISVKVSNYGLQGKTVNEAAALVGRPFVISRILHPDGSVEAATRDSGIFVDDILRIVVQDSDRDAVCSFFGTEVETDASVWETESHDLVSRRILVTKRQLNGKHISELNIRNLYGVNITRINRAGIDLIPTYNFSLQLGDRLTVVGNREAIEKVTSILGNSMKRLNEPNLIPVFIGIALGIALGSLPLHFPGMPQAIKLGLAGGPLIVAILLAKYGPALKLVTYTTMSANMMLRELGIAVFLAAVGLSAGGPFIQTLTGGGWTWIIYGFLITTIPILTVGIIARKALKMDYFTIMGLLSGSVTNPPALAYAGSVSENDKAAVTYATVYPLTMFLRILTAQLLILLSCA